MATAKPDDNLRGVVVDQRLYGLKEKGIKKGIKEKGIKETGIEEKEIKENGNAETGSETKKEECPSPKLLPLDTNQDNKLSMTEFKIYLEQQLSSQEIEDLFQQFDKTADGQLSIFSDEVSGLYLFKRLDKDCDNQLSIDEFTNYLQEQGQNVQHTLNTEQIGDLFRKFDKCVVDEFDKCVVDKDKKLSMQEFFSDEVSSLHLFKRLDTNWDNKLGGEKELKEILALVAQAGKYAKAGQQLSMQEFLNRDAEFPHWDKM